MVLTDLARHNIRVHHMLASGDRVVVAVSGGPDSVCLLHVLLQLRNELGIALHAAHLNHGLRGADADADAAFVAALAGEWGVPVTIERADVGTYRRDHKLSLEAAAREVRYAFLRRVAERNGAQAIAVAHTADDQVETILMHLLRGAGLSGLRGMLPVQHLVGQSGRPLRLIRPLLDITREQVESYVTAHNLPTCTDRSNEDESIWRNRIRRRLLPFLENESPTLRPAILRTARILADDEDYLQQQARAAWQALAEEGEGFVGLDLSGWQEVPPSVQRRLVREAWRWLTGSYAELSWVHVEQALAVAAGPTGKTVSLPQGVRWQRGHSSLQMLAPGVHTPLPDLPLLDVETLPLTVPGVTVLPNSPWRVEATVGAARGGGPIEQGRRTLDEWFDADVVDITLSLRRRKPGDRITPLGLGGTKKVQDVMVDAHMDSAWRGRVPLLVSGERILWVVGACRSEWGKVTAETRRTLRVRFVKADSDG